MKRLHLLILLLSFAFICTQCTDKPQQQEEEIKARAIWTAQQANDWYAQQPWLIGSNFVPSTAINQLEMWQAETFDTATINRELSWAKSLGMNTMRVFLHDLTYEENSDAFLQRIEIFLQIADQ
ncbi:MAG: 1,4-beta-xylanase, partial [Saprospiraceae bacterium]|nr:1,4-beta-xylanase [Saprospiraceae bacterium]